MKTKLLLLFFFSIVFLNSRAQTWVYHPFAVSNALWNGKTTTSSGTVYNLKAIIGDTTINSLTYHKIYAHSANHNNPSDTIVTIGNSTLLGGIREDSTKRIYFYCAANYSQGAQKDSVYLLYDFLLNVGDTLKFPQPVPPPWPYAYSYLVLDSVDSILVNNLYRKQYHLSPMNETWIEGIGSTRDLLSSITGYPTCACITEMICYEHDFVTYYLNPAYNNCFSDWGVGIDSYESKETISIYPNPLSSSSFTLRLTAQLKDAETIIYNILGKEIMRKSFAGNEVQIEKGKMESGVYFLKARAGEKEFVRKLIVE